MQRETIKKQFNLDYDNQISGLSEWYNTLLDKNIEQVTLIDVTKMLKQDILKELAIELAIEFLVDDPAIGYMRDGELVNLLSKEDAKSLVDASGNNLLRDVVKEISNGKFVFEWDNIEYERDFSECVGILNSKLALDHH